MKATGITNIEKNKVVATGAAIITHAGINIPFIIEVEYKHTGKQYRYGKNHYTTDAGIADYWKAHGRKVREQPGYYFMYRISYEIPDNTGKLIRWYINYPGQSNIEKVSKTLQKIHKKLSQQQEPIM